ncbi:AAA family ATPase [Streptomyces sp. NPDC050610]|uniref:helix-turn-helix transcriptional regulator n=1 Tax=Streptomyces sp. NPDC050610 TaxID=3157097 RepID=UPI003420604E
MQLVARERERFEIDRLLTSAAAGRGGVLVVTGEAGVGKSALLQAAVGGLDGFAVLRGAGAEFERDLPYAALHQLCAPFLNFRFGLPAVRRDALEAVFGLGEQTSPDPLTVGLAVLGLLNEVAEERPVCCVLDDAQWADDASRRALVFVARRVALERIAVVFATREAGAESGLADLPRLPLTGLGDEDARAVLGAVTHAGLDCEVFDRILAEAHGNPLALLEFAHDTGPFGVARPLRARAGVVGALEEQFVRRLDRLPSTTRTLVVLAAAEPVGDLGLLRRAAALLDLDAAGLDLAENAGLLTLGPRLRFRHPLVRSAVYAAATPGLRRRVHGALAEATDPEADADRRAWHRAHAVVEADEDVAAELERSADRARLRGGFAAAAAFMEQAGQLTPAADRQAGRLLGAAQLRLQAGAPAAARALVARTEHRSTDAGGSAEARLLRARVDYQLGRTPKATAALVDIAEGLDPDRARETYLEAFASFMYNANEPGGLQQLGARIRERAPRRVPARPVDLLLDALLDQNTLPVEEAVPAMLGAVAACRDSAGPSTGPLRMNLACQLVIDLRDDALMEKLTNRQVKAARRQGALAILPQALRYQAIARVSVGRFAEAAASIGEAKAVDEAAGTAPLLGAELVCIAFGGDVDRYREVQSLLGSGGRPFETAAEHYSRAVLHNGLGNHEAALEAALEARQRQRDGSYSIWAVNSELVEAAAHVGRGKEAAAALDHLEALARENPVPWAVAEWLQARALLGRGEGGREGKGEDRREGRGGYGGKGEDGGGIGGEDTEALYREAIDQFARTRVRVLYARARMTYGEWLRRENRRPEARAELRAAHDLLSAMGARGFAERAARGLRAIGARPRPHSEDPLGQLTAQERIIAGKVAAGATSKEVAAMLFLSPRTIDTHLRNIYRKLGISSRRHLRELSL